MGGAPVGRCSMELNPQRKTVATEPGAAAEDEPREIDALVSALLHVTGPEATEDEDLVTVLWEAQLGHISVDYIPSEGDVGGGTAEAEGEVAPWPTGATGDGGEEVTDPAARTLVDPPPGENPQQRSDDWTVGAETIEFEGAYAELNASAPAEVARFRAEFEVEHATPPVRAAVAVAQAFLVAETDADDLPEVLAYLPRVLRFAVRAGAWSEAHLTIGMLREAQADWKPIALVQELQQPTSVAAVREQLLAQTEDEVRDFTTFAGDLDEFATDVLGQVMAELDGAPHSKPLIEAIVARCRETPERLAPWLADRRPARVRNVVQMLGTIGGNAIVGPLQSTIQHPDPRGPAEVVNPLRSAQSRHLQPLLLSS